MASTHLSDCIAMSEDGDWFAFPIYWSRGDCWHALNDEQCTWHETLSMFRLRKGYVREIPISDAHEGGWFEACDADADGAFPAWLVNRG